MYRFGLKAVVPAFHAGISVTIACFAHATNQLLLTEKLLISESF
jgi:hypothetical protein